MTQQKAKKIIKIGKFVLIAVFAIFFVIILVQSIQLNTLTAKKQNLENDLNNKVTTSSQIEQEIEKIEINFDSYSEEELRKLGYKKENEIYL